MEIFKKVRFDAILVISPELFNEHTTRLIRKYQPSARLILYMWDSLLNKGWKGKRAVEFLKGFDRVLSFDDFDAERYGMILRPLFYIEGHLSNSNITPTYTFSFIGTIHSDRYRILKNLVASAKTHSRPIFIHPFLPSKHLYWAYRLTKPELIGTRLQDFKLSSMPYEEVLSVFRASQCIVDIEHPGQRGLTMRTIEVIGSGKHLITTNPSIRKYSFYSSNRVTIIDRLRAKLPDPIPEPESLSDDEYHSLSLHGWCEDIFGVEKPRLNT